MSDCLKDRIHPTDTFNMLLDTGDTAEGSEGVSHAVIREMSSKCKGPEVCSQNVKAVSAAGAELRG